MFKRTFIVVIAAGLAAVATPSLADSPGEVSAGLAAALDKAEAGYVRHNREHRMAEIEWNLERQRRHSYRAYRHGYDGDYGPPRGYHRRYYGPPPGLYRRGYDWDD